MYDKLKTLHDKYIVLQEKLTDQSVLQDPQKIKNISKELKDLEAVEQMYHTFKKLHDEIDDANEIINSDDDKEIKEMMQEVIKNNKKTLLDLEDEVKILLLPKSISQKFEN